MDRFKILLAIDGFNEVKIKSCKEFLESYGVQINSIYSAQTKNEIINTILKYPDINVIVVSDQLDDFISVNDLMLFNKDNNKIIIPIINGNKKGNIELIDQYFKNNFYNLLFNKDIVMKEIGELLLHGRTVQAAMAYAGFDTEDANIQFENPDHNRSTQAIFNDKSVLIAFCGTDNEFECTVSAISAANCIAMGGYKVAFVEPDFYNGTVLDTLMPCLLGKDMISCQNVDYYTGWDLTKDIFSVDVIIFDFSRMNNEESIYLSKMKKIFVCSDIDIMNIAQSSKLQNNSSFKYSVLYKDNSLIQSTSETMDVFKECSLELNRLLKITLLNSGIDITNNAEVNNLNRIKQLNILNQTERSKSSAYKIKAERQEVKRTYSDINKRNSPLNKIPLPVNTPIRLQNPAPIQKSEGNTQEHRQEKVEQVQRIQKFNTEPQYTNIVNVKESKSRLEELTITSSNSYNEVQENNVKHDTLNHDNNIQYNPRTQDDEYYNYKTKDNEKDLYSLKDDSTKVSTLSSKEFIRNNTIENKQRTFLQQKKDDKNSILPQWFPLGKDVEDEENNISSYSNVTKFGDEDDGINSLDYVDTRTKPKKKQIANQMLCGKETIFVTGLKHGCGCSHTGLSFAKYILRAYGEKLCICHKKGSYDLEDEDITEYTKDTDYDSVFATNRFIIYDCGILGELNSEQLVELNRCNIKIMVCNGDEKYLGNLSNFIRKLGNTSSEWIFAFNLVTSREKEAIIRKIMDGYKICFIPLHDRDNLPKKVSKMWDLALKRNLL